MNLKKRLLGLALVLPLMSLGTLSAQSGSSSIQGTVTDASGAVVPGAEVVLTNTSTAVVLKANTDGSGSYSFPSAPPACTRFRYRRKASRPTRFLNLL
jgi:hypothetical protein